MELECKDGEMAVAMFVRWKQAAASLCRKGVAGPSVSLVVSCI